MKNWTIRRAEHHDADALSACISAAYAEFTARIVDLPPVSANCAEEIAKHQVWVAKIEDGVAGGLVMIPEAGFIRLANIAVHPDHKGIGLGRALIERAETEASNQGYLELRLTTHVDMPENIRLYTHLGWELDHQHGTKVAMKKKVREK